MKGIVIFTAVLTVTSAQVSFPGDEDFSDGSSNSNDVDSQVHSIISEFDRNLPSQPTNDDSCSLPDGSLGTCINFSQCSSYSHLASSLKNRTVLNFLRARVCRVLSGSVHICCPVRNQPLVTLPTVPSGSQNTLIPSACGISFVDNRITEGEEIAVGSYPWLVAIGMPSRGVFHVKCGGTLITNRHVLTAAHCFNLKFTRANPTHVRVGEHDVTSDNDGARPQTHSISHMKLADYDKGNKQNDLAILTLEKEVSFNTYVQPICLPFHSDLRDNNFVGNLLDVVGWGRTNSSLKVGSPVPLEAKVEVVPLNDCQEAYNKVELSITERQLCAGTGGKDACHGDSGGPLHYHDKSGRFYLVGVTSFGRGCGRSDFPGVYARVGSYLNWIETNVK